MATLQGKRPASFKSFEQVTPAQNWTIDHNSGGYPIVDVFIDVNGELKKIIPLAVKYISPLTCLIQFSAPTAGIARIM